MNIGVILPTRGLLFTEVLISIEKELEGIPHKIYSSFTLPIPECQNYLVDEALKNDHTHLLFIEEDTVIPEGGLKAMLDLKANISCIDYGVASWGCVTRNEEGQILWCGLGCTLISRGVFEVLDKPYFRSDIELRLNDWKWIPSPKNKYGGQDIYFCVKAREKGFNISEVQGMECKHLKLDQVGQPEINKGLHQISVKPKIERRQILNENN